MARDSDLRALLHRSLDAYLDAPNGDTAERTARHMIYSHFEQRIEEWNRRQEKKR